MLAIAVIVCSLLLSREAKKIGVSSELIYDLVFNVIIGGILGARLFYIILNVQYFIQNPKEIIMVQNGGLAIQGGLVCGFLAGVWFLKRKKVSVISMLDIAAPYVALGQAIGRVGCFLNGCCFGKPVSWGVYFPVHHDHLHPTQLYLTAGYLFIFFTLRKLFKKGLPQGKIFTLYVMLACTLRFVVEIFRADHYRMFLGFSVYQIVSLVLFAIAVIFLRNINNKKSNVEPSDKS